MDYREHFAGLSCDMLISKAVWYAERSDMLEEENRKLREVIRELEQSNKVLTSKVNGAEEVIEGLEKELAQTHAELDNRVKNLRERIEAKNGLIGTLKAKLDNARNTIEALKSRNNDNHEIAADLELNNRKLQVRIQELEKQLKQAAELGDACMDKIRDLEKSNKVLTSKVNGAEEVIEGLEKELAQTRAELDNRVKNLREQVEAKNGLIGILRAQLDNIIEINAKLDNMIKELIKLKDDLYTQIREREKTIADLNDEFVNLMETKLGVINSFNLDGEGEYLELMLTHETGKSFMRNVKVFKKGTAIKVSDFVKTEKPVTPKDLWTAGETVAEGFAAGVKAKKPEEPICKSVPCSMAIGVLEDCIIDEDGMCVKMRLTPYAEKFFIKDCKFPPLDGFLYVEDFADVREIVRMNLNIPDPFTIPELFPTRHPQKPRINDYDSIAKHIKNKYDALRKVGFTDDQAMAFLPMWDDEDYV